MHFGIDLYVPCCIEMLYTVQKIKQYMPISMKLNLALSRLSFLEPSPSRTSFQYP